MHSSAKVVSQKICLIGDFGVGKTSLIRQFVDRQFSDKYLSTVGVKISRKLVSMNNLSDNTPVDFMRIFSSMATINHIHVPDTIAIW